MPWCDDCDRYLNPNTVRDDGTCPQCGSHIAQPSSLRRARQGRGSSADAMAVRSDRARATDAATAAAGDGDDSDERLKTPWHFKVLVVALIIYLAWRAFQGVAWLTHHL